MNLSISIIQNHFVQNNLIFSSNIIKGDMVLEGLRFGPSGGDPRFVELLPDGEGTLLSAHPDSIRLPDIPIHEAHNIVAGIFEHYSAWERDMYVALASGASLQKILDIAEPEFRRPMFIKSSTGRIDAITQGYPSDVHPLWEKFEESARTGMLEAESTEFVSSDPEYSAVFSHRSPVVVRSPLYGGMVLRCNIWHKDHWVYEIVVFANGKPFSSSDIHLMSVLSSVIECYSTANAEVFQSFSNVTDFFTKLLRSGECGSTSLLLIYNTMGWHPQDELAIVSISSATGQDTPAMGMLRATLTQELHHAVVLQRESRLDCVIDVSLFGSYSKALSRLSSLIPGDTFVWGISYGFTGIERAHLYAPQAIRARDEAIDEGRDKLTMYDIACRWIGEKLRENSQDYSGLVHPGVLMLIEKDKSGHSHYADTLFEYLLCGGNFTDTSLRLGIHRNSLIYRINRIQEMLDSDLSSPSDRKLLLYSFILLGY